MHGTVSLSQLIKAMSYSVLNKIVLTLPEFFFGHGDQCRSHAPSPFLEEWAIVQTTHQLAALATFTMFLWFISSLFYYVESIAWQQCAQTLQHGLRLKGYEKVYHHNNTHVDKDKIGNYVTILNDDINMIESFFRFAANDVIHLIVGTLMIGCTYLYYSPLIALVALLPLPLIIMLSLRFQKRLQLNYLLTRNQAGKLASHVTTALQTGRFNESILEQESLYYRDIALDAARANALVNPVINSIIAGGFMITIGVSGYCVLIGTLSAGTFSIITLQTQRLLWPFARTAQIIDAYERTVASALRIQGLIEQTLHEVPKSITSPQSTSIQEKNI